MKNVCNYHSLYERRLRRYCFGYPGPHLKNPDPDTAHQNILQTLSFRVTTSRLTVLESLDLTDFESVFGYLVWCLDPDFTNVGRGFQTLSAKLNFKIPSVRCNFFYLRKRKRVSIPFQKDLNLEISTSNKGIRGYFVFLKKVFLATFFLQSGKYFFEMHLPNL